MPIQCTFSLNNKSMSVLHCPGAGAFKAFSGDKASTNNPADIAIPNAGPLPPGRYYIVDRGSGGLFTHLTDYIGAHTWSTDKSQWFSLYSATTMDDWLFVHGVRRGNFRLHPAGPKNLSEGCITLADPVAFVRLRAALKAASRMPLPGGKGFAYGTVDVQ
ncbi:Protein of unknown function [Paraburkholderia lycopersici]|uniref:Tlde1 domain-containing protein n=2 Tax=Paraburkholderia lycopersici TaxID=416944 RepID=A0A1G6NTI3_9BURK|nr:Protein of unknown function [Paraburkholderia lycopersici]